MQFDPPPIEQNSGLNPLLASLQNAARRIRPLEVFKHGDAVQRSTGLPATAGGVPRAVRGKPPNPRTWGILPRQGQEGVDELRVGQNSHTAGIGMSSFTD